MVKIAFTLPYFKNWIGGYNYILNLISVLSKDDTNNIEPILFLGNDILEEEITPFLKIENLKIITDNHFNLNKKNLRLFTTLASGKDIKALKIFRNNDINLVFESAQFYGTQFPIPIIAWLPDFQHRHMPQKFNFFSYWKRELGFRKQTSSGRSIMVSSEDSKKDCEIFYPSSKGSIYAISFAVMNVQNNFSEKSIERIKIKYSLPTSYFFLPNQFWVHKNHICIIEALNIIKKRGIKIKIIATGNEYDPRDNNYFSRLEKKIDDFKIQNYFTSLGIVPFSDFQILLHKCNALINPSYFEGWSTTVEEAKATNTPMILSSIAVHKEQAGNNAFYFNPQSPIELANLLTELSQSSRESLIEQLNLKQLNYKNNINYFVTCFRNLVIQTISK
jgi:glycosyltransferase involved in cell wall biosynthesis